MRSLIAWGIVVLLGTGGLGCQKPATPPQPATTPTPLGGAGDWQLSSSAFEPGAKLPAKYTADGTNVSPPLSWGKPPEGTQALALVMEDPDAPSGSFTHWLVWDIPAAARELGEGVEPNAQLPDQGGCQGTNDFGKTGYGGPAPPPGRAHTYRFTLYALDAPLNVEPGSPASLVRRALTAHTRGQAVLTATYGQ